MSLESSFNKLSKNSLQLSNHVKSRFLFIYSAYLGIQSEPRSSPHLFLTLRKLHHFGCQGVKRSQRIHEYRSNSNLNCLQIVNTAGKKKMLHILQAVRCKHISSSE